MSRLLVLVFFIFNFSALANMEYTEVGTINLGDVIILGNYNERDYYSDANNSTVINSDDFDTYQATHFEELTQMVPGLNATKGSSRARFFTIRGVGERSSYEGMPNNSVGIIMDDIDYSGSGGVSNLGGIAQVEVYKGPQSTRMGPSAIGGMIYMTTKDPTQKKEGSLFASVESFNTFKEQIFYSTPITNNLGMNFSVAKVDSDGFIENTYLDKQDTSGLDEISLKTKAVYKKEKLKAIFNLHYHNNNNGYDYFVQDNSLKTKSDKPGEDDQTIAATSLKLEYGHKKLKHILLMSHFDDQSFYSYDEDWGNDELWNATTGYNADYDYNIEFTKDKRHYFFEQRTILDGDLILGLYHKNANERFREKGFQDEAVRKNISGRYNTKNYAVFIQNTNKIKAKHFLEYGFRVETRIAEYKDSLGNTFDPEETMNGGNISYRIQKDKNNMQFITLSKGFKAGGFNTQDGVEQGRRSFEQETAYNLEIGSKNIWESGVTSFVTAFYTIREDVQVRTSYQDDPTDPSSYTFYTDNGTSGRSYGLEAEISFFHDSGLEIKSGVSLLKTEYNDYDFGETNLKGRAYPNAPSYTLNTLLKYQLNDKYFVSTNVFFSDEFYYANSHDQKHPKYELVDMTVGYNSQKWNISLWCKNIFDREYYARGFFFANEPPTWQDELYTQRNSPRMFGVTGRYSF